ncbi:MAG: hypothetical protein M3Z75_27590 [Actinomycetota bacterium]|nr:hypothetical protein [Actinomycetota bacterium]
MTEQASSGTVSGAEADTGSNGLDLLPGVPHEAGAHHGRRSSWVAVSLVITGFIVSGVSMIPRPTWWIFWLGAGIAVIGAIMATTTRIFDDWY